MARHYTRHGDAVRKEARLPEYQAWVGIKARCLNPNSASYHRYGERGITICDLWKDNYPAFIAHVGPRPSPLHSINRVDNDLGYEPGNVVWSTRTEQQRNQRSNRLITFDGETRCIAEWADHLGVQQGTLYSRLWLGWSDEETLTGCRPGKKRPPQAKCSKGHPFDEVNTYIRKNGKRMCRICQQARNPAAVAAYRARKRAVVQS